ncbi:hypothetical protein ABZ612_28975 [Streptomyces avermitilis]|uniref:hypothetical protein n=1 Tax=Streptomyces avermitilis TaxID=33903 RepID=UPI0033CA03A5
MLAAEMHGVLQMAELGNRDDSRRTALPANGMMTARGAARMYAVLACGGELEGYGCCRRQP